MWKETVKSIKIDLENACISIHNTNVKMFRSLRRLLFYDKCVRGSL
jgi:hypothetical protein